MVGPDAANHVTCRTSRLMIADVGARDNRTHSTFVGSDSAMVARDANRNLKWSGTFTPRTKAARAITVREYHEGEGAT